MLIFDTNFRFSRLEFSWLEKLVETSSCSHPKTFNIHKIYLQVFHHSNKFSFKQYYIHLASLTCLSIQGFIKFWQRFIDESWSDSFLISSWKFSQCEKDRINLKSFKIFFYLFFRRTPREYESSRGGSSSSLPIRRASGIPNGRDVIWSIFKIKWYGKRNF